MIINDPDPAKMTLVYQRLRNPVHSRQEGYLSDSRPLPIADGTATRVVAMEVLENTSVDHGSCWGALDLVTVPGAHSERVQEGLAPTTYFQPPSHIQVFEEADFKPMVETVGSTVEGNATSGLYRSMWWCLN